MDPDAWIFFHCRACRKPVRLARGMAGLEVICPLCRTKVQAPLTSDATALAVVMASEEAARQTVLPTTRNPELSGGVSGKAMTARADWERGGRSVGEPLALRNLQSTEEVRQTVGGPQEMVRVDLRKLRPSPNSTDFDDPDVAERRRRMRRSPRHGRGGHVARRRLFAVSMALLGAAVVGMLAWTIMKLGGGKSAPGLPPGPQATAPALESSGMPAVLASPAAAPTLEGGDLKEHAIALSEAVQHFAASRTVDEMLKMVRDRERVEPLARRYYTPENPWQPIALRPGQGLPTALSAVQNIIIAGVQLENFDTVPVAAELTSAGFRIDWESFVGYGEMSWDAFMRERPRQPVLMRVVVKRGPSTDFYAQDFPDDKTHQCYQISDRSADHVLSGYAPRSGAVDTMLQKALVVPGAPPPRGGLECHAVVRLRYPANSTGNRQVEITEFLEKGWVFREDDAPPGLKEAFTPFGPGAPAPR